MSVPVTDLAFACVLLLIGGVVAIALGGTSERTGGFVMVAIGLILLVWIGASAAAVLTAEESRTDPETGASP